MTGVKADTTLSRGGEVIAKIFEGAKESPGHIIVVEANACCPAQSATGYSQRSYCTSLHGFAEPPLRGLSLFIQCRISCMPSLGFEFQFPARTGGRSPVSGAGGMNESPGYLSIAYSMTSCHMGAMMNDAMRLSIGELSLLPAHAPIAMPGV